MNALQKKRVAKLVAALRSGKYKPAKGSLRDGENYCCLGVACEVYRTTARRGAWIGESTFADVCGSRIGSLPPDVSDWYGFDSSDPLIGKTTHATTANDIHGWGFKRIATGFERTYLKPAARRKA